MTISTNLDRRRQFICFDKAPPGQPVTWWQSRWFWGLLALGSLLPFLLSPLPPLGDLYSHIGRYHVMLDEERSPFLQQYYRFQWQLVPNLGQDLLVLIFGQWLGAEKAAFLVTALIPPATILLIRQLSIACHGSVQPTALLATPFAYSFTYLWGFMNFHTGLTLAMAVVVLWLRLRQSSAPLRFGVLAALSAIVWVFHVAAWAILVVVIGAYEIAHLVKRHGFDLRSLLRDGWLAGLAVLWPVFLHLLMEPAGSSIKYVVSLWDIARQKQRFLIFPLRDEIAWVDILTLYVLFAAAILLLLRKRAKVEAGLALAAALLFFLFLITPTDLMNGFYADLRLLPMMWILALIALRTSLNAREATLMAVIGLAIFSFRIALTSYGWATRGAALQQDLGALAHIPRGARIAQASPDRVCLGWESSGMTHLASFAIFRRDAFVNTEWVIPGAQVMKPVYLEGSPYNSFVRIRYDDCGGVAIEDWLDQLPRDRFDFVWLFRFQPTPSSRKWLSPVFAGRDGTLYRIVKP